MSNIFIAFLLCCLSGLFVWYWVSEQYDERISQFNKELQTLQARLSEMSDERRDAQTKLFELQHIMRKYENTLEGVIEESNHVYKS